jgi:hypothetical protein
MSDKGKNRLPEECKEEFHAGSEGSLVYSENLRKYPEQAPASLNSPKTTEFTEEEIDDPLRKPTETERIRRENNRVRDNRRRWGVVNAPLSVMHAEDPVKK